jgi:hypothetical protein
MGGGVACIFNPKISPYVLDDYTQLISMQDLKRDSSIIVFSIFLLDGICPKCRLCCNG